MSISVVQQAKNSSAYQTKPLVVTLPTGTTAGSRLAVIIEAQKSGYPFNVGNLNANTTTPTITDDKGNTYTLVRSIVNQTQEVAASPALLSPDASGYFPSVYFFVSSGAATTSTQSISLGSFYPDEITSPPMTQGRPVFDGGIQAQVFEIAGLTTGVDASSYGSSAVSALGNHLITTSGAAIILEVGLLLDSSVISPAATATLQHSGTLISGSSHFVVQTTIVGTATQSLGFTNPLLYTGSVIAVSLK